MKIVLRPFFVIAANAIALFAAQYLLPEFVITGGLWSFVWVAFLLAILNLLVRPLLTLIMGPLIILTLGLALIVINAFVLYLLDLLSQNISITGVTQFIVGAIIIGLVNTVLEKIYK